MATYNSTLTARDSRRERDNTLRKYAAAAVIILALALVSVLAVPHQSSGTSRCNSLLLEQDKYGCVESVAVSTRNSTACALLPSSYSDSCYASIAINTSDPRLCGLINSTNLSDGCYVHVANYTHDISICGYASQPAGSECAYGMAVEEGNASACSLVRGYGGQLECESTIYFDIALKNSSQSYCTRIRTNNDTAMAEGMLQNSSLGSYTGLGFNITQAIEFSAYYNGTMGARDMCYASLAYKSGNSTYCSLIQNNGLSNICTKQSAAGTQSSMGTANSVVNVTALLNSCSGQQNEAACRYQYMTVAALQTDNVTLCKEIPAAYSATCFYYLAVKYNDTAYCSYIENTTLNTACVGDIEGLYPTTTNTSG